ncbi:MAG: ThiF family adenylyltransferase [Syntrophobacterales bacterium]|nr:MAG: ThiF family adenylyltransferase [Syntrophobacterales bacterium]
MGVEVRIPSPLKPHMHGKDVIQRKGSTVGGVIQEVISAYPQLKERLYDEKGDMRRFINIFLHDEDIRFMENLETPVNDGYVFSITPAIAGGSESIPCQVIPGSGYSSQSAGMKEERLKEGKVFILGAGGLGSPAALYLASAGVGTLGIADSDVVDLSNLHRQLLHFTKDVGREKVRSAKGKLKALNPDVRVRTYRTRVTSGNVREIIRPYDVIIDGSDNFPTKFLINDACYFEKKPLVLGGILKFYGQATVFNPWSKGPCYRCIVPNPPPPGTVPSCQEAGVIGAIAGIIGMVQAFETIKLLSGLGDPLIGRFLVFDALDMTFNEFNIERNENCPLCGKDASITQLVDYQQVCQA